MLDADLRCPRPQVPGIGERGNSECGERCGSQRCKEQTGRAGDKGSMAPIQSNRPRAQTHEAHGDAIRCIREPTSKIKMQVRAGSSARNVRTECLESNLALATCSTAQARSNEQRRT